jgi:thymidylate synthase
MNNLDKQYQTLLQDIIDNGVTKSDRTGTGTISVFGRQIRHKMSDGFPLLTTKKMPFKTIVTELLWFLRGDTNIKYLVDNNCHIWDGDCYKRYYTEWSKSVPGDGTFSSNEYSSPSKYEACNFTKEEFINKIKTDDEFAKKWGELGPIYGKQWRSWGYREDLKLVDNNRGDFEYEKVITTGIDQIYNLINELKTNPDSRRLMVSAWNVGALDAMVLPPCHYGFQVYTREIPQEERWKMADLTPNMSEFDLCSKSCDDYNIPKRYISLMWNQRSVDTFLGLPFNIASYGLLLEIIAREVDMIPDELIGNLGDVHLYSNHIEQAKEQIGRKYTHEERVNLLRAAMPSGAYEKLIGELVPFGGGMSEYYDLYKIPIYTREPYSLPTLSYLDEYHYLTDSKIVGEISFSEKINNFRPDFFKIENYQSHPSIKAPLSN